MRARTKLTLLTASFALFVAIGFSSIVFFEMLEQPFRLIDRDLSDLGAMVRQQLGTNAVQSERAVAPLAQPPFASYWISVREAESGLIVLASPMARFVTFPVVESKTSFFVSIDENSPSLKNYPIHPLDTWLFSGMVLRVRHTSEAIAGKEYEILIGKPIPDLVHELIELVMYLLLAWVVCTVLIVWVSYLLSGRILQPIVRINSLAREITENSLDRRLPESDSADELAVLIRSLNTMFDRLEHSFQRQREFVGNAAHELKSPLAVLILGSERMLTEDLPPSLYPALEKQLEILNRLAHFVAGLLEISRLEQHQHFVVEPIDIKKLLEDLLEEFEPLFQDRKITVTAQLEACALAGDREKILRLFINLIDNAIKYNKPHGGGIDLAVKKKADYLECDIANTGVQIPPEFLAKIFDQFFRVEQSRSAQFGGAGLGLTIARQIVELHHGTITVSSGSDGWIRFVVRLPMKNHL